MTGEPAVVEALLDRAVSLRGTDWVPLWTARGGYWEREAQTALQAGDHVQEVRALRRASAYYLIASYPWIKDEERYTAYASGRVLFQLACQRAGILLDILDIPFGTHRLRAYVQRTPQVPKPRGLILFIRGLDSTKEVMYWDEQIILAKGWIVVSIDFPGMGENICTMTVDAENQLQAVLDAVSPDGIYANLGLTTNRIVAWGLGFGGYWAFKLAAVDSRVMAAINIGGPIHYSFSVSVLRFLRSYREISFLKRLVAVSLGPDSLETPSAFCKQLSLVRNGLLARTATPLLYINGDQDLAATSREADVVCQYRPRNVFVERKICLFHGAGHLAIERLNQEVLPRCLDWLDGQVPQCDCL
jgi:pimeloyl-ACP methyl ester carboxylesterase